jgi:PAS domain S-box-containing protein
MLNSLLDSVVDGVISIDPLGIIKRFNKSAERIFGYTADEVHGQNVQKLMPDSYARNHDDCKRIL